MKIVYGMIAMSLLACAQEPAPAVKVERKLIQLKYVSANRVHNLLRNYTNANLDSDDNLHTIAVRGTTDAVAAFEEAVKKLDLPPLDFELTVYLISATPQPGRGTVCICAARGARACRAAR